MSTDVIRKISNLIDKCVENRRPEDYEAVRRLIESRRGSPDYNAVAPYLEVLEFVKDGFFVVADRKWIIETGMEEIYQLLRTGLFHLTTPEGFKGIAKDKNIMPNSGQFPRLFPQSKGSYGDRRGMVCLFDFESTDEKDSLSLTPQWIGFVACYEPCGVLIRLDRTALSPKLVSFQEAFNEVDYAEFYFPCIEAWHRGPIPLDHALDYYVIILQPKPPKIKHIGRDTSAVLHQLSQLGPN